MRFNFFALAAISITTACGGSDGGTTTTRTVARVTVEGGTTVLRPTETTQLAATAVDASGATVPNAGIVLWSSASTPVATVSQGGKVTAVSPGAAVITADVAGVKGSIGITVNQPIGATKDTIFSISIATFSPASLTVNAGATVIFALGFDGTGHDLRFTTPGAPSDIPVTLRQYVPRTFPTAGSFSFFCPTHPQMTGVVTVR